MAHGEIHPEDVPQELRDLIADGTLSDVWEQALGDLSEEHLNTLIEIQRNATSPEDVAAGLAANRKLAIVLGRNIAGIVGRPLEFRENLSRAHECIKKYDATGNINFINEAIDAFKRISSHPNFASYSDEGGLSVLANSSPAIYVVT